MTEPYKPKIKIYPRGGSMWENLNEYFFTYEGREFIKRMREFAKQHIKNDD